MVHQVAADLIARIRHAARQTLGARLQQQLRRLDAVRGNHEHLADRAVFRAIRALDDERADPAIRTDLDVRNDASATSCAPARSACATCVVASYFACTGQIGMQLLLPQQAGRLS